jgi:flagellar FliL protein
MAKNADDSDDKKAGPAGKIKMVAIALPMVLLVVGALYFFVLAPKSGDTQAGASAGTSASQDGGADSADGSNPEPTSTEEPGVTVVVEPVTINLAGGHYLKVGLLLQATKDAGEEVPAGKAADALIAQFSGRTVDELATEQGRAAAKTELLKVIKKIYEKKVYEIYYTAFVMN